MFVSSPLFDALMRGTILSAAGLFWVVLLVRVNGLRSFSKMTSFDFVMTVAIGSLVAGAGQSTEWSGFLQTLVGMATLFLVQFALARARKRWRAFETFIQNEPVLLMRDGKIDHDALKRTRVAEDDLFAKLREANALELENVRAVVLETTGDISVLHGNRMDDRLLDSVKAA